MSTMLRRLAVIGASTTLTTVAHAEVSAAPTVMRSFRDRLAGAAMRRRCLAILIAPLPLAALIALPAAATEPVAVACGQVITKDTQLIADLVCAGDGVTLQGTLVFDLHGHRITATSGAAITVLGDGSPTIKRGSITDSFIGLDFPNQYLQDALPRSVAVSNMTFARNDFGIDASETGVYFGNSRVTAIAIAKSHFHANSSGLTGQYTGPIAIGRSSFTNNGGAIDIDTGAALTVSKSYFADNGAVLYSIEADPVRISDSRLVNNTLGISSGWGELTIERTKISGSKTAVFHSAADAVLTNNLFYDNTTGVHLGYTGTLTGNRFLRNQTGFTTTDWGEPQPSITLTRNSFVKNGDGICTEAGNLKLRRNLAIHNRKWGIYAPNATDLGGNRARANGESPQCVGVICT